MNDPLTFDYLTVDDLLEIAAAIVGDVRLRDAGLLESAAARPQTTVFGSDAYPELADKAAALMHSIARSHPLVDGNKRLAWSAARAFLLINGHDVTHTVDDAESIVLGVATSTLDVSAVARWVSERLVDSPD